MPIPNFCRVERPDQGFSIAVPQDWPEEPSDLNNSPYEIARFGLLDGDSRYVALVFRRTDDAEPQVWLAANAARGRLKRSGFTSMSLTECEWAGREGVRIDCQREYVGPGGLWTVREYVAVSGGIVYILGLGANQPEKYGPVFDEVARQFQLLTPDA